MSFDESASKLSFFCSASVSIPGGKSVVCIQLPRHTTRLPAHEVAIKSLMCFQPTLRSARCATARETASRRIWIWSYITSKTSGGNSRRLIMGFIPLIGVGLKVCLLSRFILRQEHSQHQVTYFAPRLRRSSDPPSSCLSTCTSECS